MRRGPRDTVFFEDADAIARELIADVGFSITLYEFQPNPDNPDKPWEGPTMVIRNTIEASDEYVRGVVIPPTGLADLGLEITDEDLFKTCEQIVIAYDERGSSGGKFPDILRVPKVEDCHEVLLTDYREPDPPPAEQNRWKIVKTHVLNPVMTKPLLYFLATTR